MPSTDRARPVVPVVLVVPTLALLAAMSAFGYATTCTNDRSVFDTGVACEDVDGELLRHTVVQAVVLVVALGARRWRWSPSAFVAVSVGVFVATQLAWTLKY